MFMARAAGTRQKCKSKHNLVLDEEEEEEKVHQNKTEAKNKTCLTKQLPHAPDGSCSSAGARQFCNLMQKNQKKNQNNWQNERKATIFLHNQKEEEERKKAPIGKT